MGSTPWASSTGTRFVGLVQSGVVGHFSNAVSSLCQIGLLVNVMSPKYFCFVFSARCSAGTVSVVAYHFLFVFSGT